MTLQCPIFNTEEKLSSPNLFIFFIAMCHESRVAEGMGRVTKLPLNNQVGKYQFYETCSEDSGC